MLPFVESFLWIKLADNIFLFNILLLMRKIGASFEGAPGAFQNKFGSLSLAERLVGFKQRTFWVNCLHPFIVCPLAYSL